MSTNSLAKKITSFLNSGKDYPLLAAVAAGLYPILFYYSRNFTMVNSWDHLLFFLLAFIFVPAIVFFAACKLFSLDRLNSYKKYILPFLNMLAFLYFLKLCLFVGPQRKIVAAIIVVSAVYAYLFHAHLKKIMVVQWLLAGMGVIALLNTLNAYAQYDEDWLQQPDAIVEATFRKKPNVYFIQPDGYINPSEFGKGHYTTTNDGFHHFLQENGFVLYDNFRSNYNTTLSSNAAIFGMRHHYFKRDAISNEVYRARELIMGKNPVLQTFKNNGYKTYFIFETPYLLLNRPALAYDESNISYSSFNYIHNGIGDPRPVLPPLHVAVSDKIEQPKFIFMQLLKPWHIRSHKAHSRGTAEERAAWYDRLEEANSILTSAVNTILEQDPGALIILMSDHGGYVGMEYTDQTFTKSQDRDLIYSVFSSILAIHWPEGEAPSFDSEFASSVNMFRIVFAYLSENASYLETLEEDASYVVLREGAEEGIYKYLNDAGEIVFEPLD
jgi:hypothetical protein